MASTPKKQTATAQEVALGIRQTADLSKEIATSEKRFKALTRNRLGAKSLLSGAPSSSAVDAGPKTEWSTVNAPKPKGAFKKAANKGIL